VHDGVDAVEVRIVDRPDVLRERQGRGVQTVVQPAGPVEAGVDAHDVVAVAEQLRAEEATEVALGACHKNLHGVDPSRE
jgi:hypothetical protein